MGGAFVGRADDASAIYYNPAGIAFLENTNILGAITLVKPDVTITFAGTSTESEQRQVQVPSFFIAHKVNDDLAIGFGIFAPIGLGVQYPENYTGNFVSYRSMGMAVFFRPTIAYKINDQLSIGGSIDIVYSQMKVWRKLPFSMMGLALPGAVDNRTEVDGTGFGFSVGLLYKANEMFQIGAKYRHKVEVDYEGDTQFTYPTFGNAFVDGMLSNMFYDQKTLSGITTPAEFTVGTMIKVDESLGITADLAYTMWDTMDVIPLTYEVDMLSQDWVMNWENTWSFKIGAEYKMTENVALRAGYVRDTSPIPAETLTPFAPDADRNEVTFGFGYEGTGSGAFGHYFLDAAVRYIMLEDITSEFAFYPADFETTMTFFGVSMGTRF